MAMSATRRPLCRPPRADQPNPVGPAHRCRDVYPHEMAAPPPRRRISWTKPVVALLLTLGMVSMCTIVATTMSMPMADGGAVAQSTTTTVPGASGGFAAADKTADEQPCATCSSVECTAVAVTIGLALFGLLLLLLRQRSYLVGVMRSLVTARRKSWRPPRLRLTPIRFQLCVMRT